jgi:hypothetical protein
MRIARHGTSEQGLVQNAARNGRAKACSRTSRETTAGQFAEEEPTAGLRKNTAGPARSGMRDRTAYGDSYAEVRIVADLRPQAIAKLSFKSEGRTMTDDNKLRAAVERMFDDHSFKKVTNCMWLYGAVIDGIKVGVNEATHNPNFGNFTLNCKEFRRMIDAESSGRAGAVYVVKTRYDASTYKKRVIEVIEATALEKTLRTVEPRTGKHGPFWTLPDPDGEEFM